MATLTARAAARPRDPDSDWRVATGRPAAPGSTCPGRAAAGRQYAAAVRTQADALDGGRRARGGWVGAGGTRGQGGAWIVIT